MDHLLEAHLFIVLRIFSLLMSMYDTCAGFQRVYKRTSDLLEVGSQEVVSGQVGAGNSDPLKEQQVH